MKYCEDYAALLDLYVDGELSPEDMDRVRAHLETCSGCRAYVDDALAIRAAFPDVEDTEVPTGFAESVMSAVQAAAQERPAAPQAKKRHWGRVLLPLAACCAIVILLHGVTGSKNSPVEFATASSSATDTATTESESIAETEEAAAEAPAETPADGAADGGAAPETRVAFTTSDAGTGASVNDQASSKALPETGVVEVPAGAAVPEAQAEEPEEAGVEAASSVSAFATLRLTTAQAGDLLAEHAPVSDADGVLCYELSREDYDALLAALADTGITPEPDAESAASDGAMSDGFALVYVADEWPEDAD
ncbi:MAG: zf-HC2 domain-containing protein [Dysosmobacter sp.]|nr:zf-HC2 domain-containing protein [Dysosmobacter sp.]